METAEWIKEHAFKSQRISHLLVLTLVTVAIINIMGCLTSDYEFGNETISFILIDYTADFIFCLVFVILSIFSAIGA